MTYWWDPETGAEKWPASAECNGLCLTAYDIGLSGSGIAYPHPSCALHGGHDVWPDKELTLKNRLAADRQRAALRNAYVCGLLPTPIEPPTN